MADNAYDRNIFLRECGTDAYGESNLPARLDEFFPMDDFSAEFRLERLGIVLALTKSLLIRKDTLIESDLDFQTLFTVDGSSGEQVAIYPGDLIVNGNLHTDWHHLVVLGNLNVTGIIESSYAESYRGLYVAGDIFCRGLFSSAEVLCGGVCHVSDAICSGPANDGAFIYARNGIKTKLFVDNEGDYLFEDGFMDTLECSCFYSVFPVQDQENPDLSKMLKPGLPQDFSDNPEERLKHLFAEIKAGRGIWIEDDLQKHPG